MICVRIVLIIVMLIVVVINTIIGSRMLRFSTHNYCYMYYKY